METMGAFTYFFQFSKCPESLCLGESAVHVLVLRILRKVTRVVANGAPSPVDKDFQTTGWTVFISNVIHQPNQLGV